jgi:hypothetical protein
LKNGVLSARVTLNEAKDLKVKTEKKLEIALKEEKKRND